MHHRLFLPFALAAVTQLPAQTFTTPAGVDTTEGTEWFFMFGTRRLQALDNTVPGPIANITSIAFRRDGVNTSPDGVARTMNVEVIMGTCNFATRGTNFANNLATSTIAVATRNVSFPNWVPVPATLPAPFDFLIPFDAPWSYPGGQAFAWDIKCSGGTNTDNAPMDRHGWSNTLGLTGTPLGTGCTVPGRAGPYTHLLTVYDSGPTSTMRIRYSGTNGPASAMTVMHMDVFDAAIALPGLLCGTLHSLGSLVALTTTNTTSGGAITERTLSFPYSAAVVGLPLVTQLLSLDAGQAPNLPVALSNGQSAFMPPYLDVAYVYGSPTAVTGAIINAGTLPVAQFTY